MSELKKDDIKFSTTAEVNAELFFAGEDDDVTVNWEFCTDFATFTHREACEFILHCGDADSVAQTAKSMEDYGCTKDFIEAYKLAAASGAVRVLFWS